MARAPKKPNTLTLKPGVSIYFNEQSLSNKMSSSYSSLGTKLQILVQSGVHQKKKPKNKQTAVLQSC